MPISPTVDPDDVAWIDTATMREIDRVMVDELGIALLQMMENAGRSLADLVVTRYQPDQATVLAGPGGNGGGGLTAARHLVNVGVDVDVVLVAGRERFTAAAAHQLSIIDRMGIPTIGSDDWDHQIRADVVIDAMVGYSLAGPLRPAAADAATAAGQSAAVVVSLDVPSGVDATVGPGDGNFVSADTTLTLCLPKLGLRHAPATGELFLADISVPASVVRDVTGGPAPPFDRGRVLRVTS
jgi:NAD(P)H-hydrate epimerase